MCLFKIFLFFWRWAILKVFVEFFTILLLFYVLILWLQDVWDLSPWPGLKPTAPALERQSLNQWATRESVLVTQSCVNLYDSMDWSPQAPLSMGFSRQEYWSGLPFPSSGDLPDPGMEPWSPEWQADSFPSEPPEKFPPMSFNCHHLSYNTWKTRTLFVSKIMVCYLHFHTISGMDRPTRGFLSWAELSEVGQNAGGKKKRMN